MSKKRDHRIARLFTNDRISAVAISLSTAFVKQHSVVDIFAAIPLGLLAEYLVFGPTRLNRRIENSGEGA